MSASAEKRIHVVIDNITTGGGIERVCSVLLPMLAREARVRVLGLLDNTAETVYDFEGVEIVPLLSGQESAEVGQGGYLRLLSKAFANIRKDRPDIVLYLTMGRLSVFAAPFVMKDRLASKHTRHIACEHIAFSSHSGAITRLKRLALPRYDRVVFLTARDLDNFSERRRLLHIPNPSPFTTIAEPRSAVQEKLALGVGRLTAQKGFDMLIPAWKAFVERHPDWKLLIVGEGEDRESLTRLIREHQLENHCELYGNSRDIGALYRRADLMLMPSRFEGLPMTLIEAQAHALPIVAFDCETGPREIVTDGEDGFLVPAFDQPAFAEAIARAAEPTRYPALSAAAARSAERFDREQILRHWQSLFESLETPTPRR